MIRREFDLVERKGTDPMTETPVVAMVLNLAVLEGVRLHGSLILYPKLFTGSTGYS